jgi:hypothetical protein
MRYRIAFGIAALVGGAHNALAHDGHGTAAAQAPAGETGLHFRKDFSFVVQAPIEVAGPLFGADKERVWAPGWNPAFLWPREAGDQAGMVFTIPHGERTAVWVNTVFDLAAGRVQYVYVLPDVVATVVSLQLTPAGKYDACCGHLRAHGAERGSARCSAPYGRARRPRRPGLGTPDQCLSVDPSPDCPVNGGPEAQIDLPASIGQELK